MVGSLIYRSDRAKRSLGCRIVLGNRQRSLERPRYAGRSSVGYTRASCFSELSGLPGPSPHQALAVRDRCRCRSREPPIRRSRSAGLPGRLSVAPREGGAAETRVVALVIAIVAGLVTLVLRLSKGS